MMSQGGPIAYGIIDENMPHEDVKVCLLGRHMVGKTSITNRFVHGTFGHKYVSTVGAAFSSKSLHFRDVEYRFALWDTAGEEKFRSLAPLTYRNASAAIIVYDITNKDSFKEVEYWMKELRREGPESLLVYVVGNKIDLESSRVVDQNVAYNYATSNGAFHFQSSAKTGSGVEEVFTNICQMLRTVMHEKGGLRRVDTIRVESVDSQDVRDDEKDPNGCHCKNT